MVLKKFNYIRKNMKLLITAILFVVLSIIGFQIVNSYYQLGNNSEKTIESLYAKSESTLSNFTTEILELTQVTGKYKEDLSQIIKESLQGRYGENGSQAVFQFLKEQNLNLDSNLYLNLQNRIIAGRSEFKNSQEKILDVCKQYKIELDGLFSGPVLRIFKYPKIDLKEYCTIVSDEQTKETFKTKIQKPIQLK